MGTPSTKAPKQTRPVKLASGANKMADEDGEASFGTPREDDSVFTEEERLAIEALRAKAQSWIDDGAGSTTEPSADGTEPSADGTEAGDYLDDSTLWRYAKAREFDVDRALEMFQATCHPPGLHCASCPTRRPASAISGTRESWRYSKSGEEPHTQHEPIPTPEPNFGWEERRTSAAIMAPSRPATL